MYYGMNLVASSKKEFVPSRNNSVQYSQPGFTKECKKVARKKNKLYDRAKEQNCNTTEHFLKKQPII